MLGLTSTLCRYDMFNVRMAFAIVSAADRRYSLHKAWPSTKQTEVSAKRSRYLGPSLRVIFPSPAVVVKALTGDAEAATYRLAALEVPGLPEVRAPLLAAPACSVQNIIAKESCLLQDLHAFLALCPSRARRTAGDFICIASG